MVSVDTAPPAPTTHHMKETMMFKWECQKIIKPYAYTANAGAIFKAHGSHCTLKETYLLDDSRSEDHHAFAIFAGQVSQDQIERIAAILNEGG